MFQTWKYFRHIQPCILDQFRFLSKFQSVAAAFIRNISLTYQYAHAIRRLLNTKLGNFIIIIISIIIISCFLVFRSCLTCCSFFSFCHSAFLFSRNCKVIEPFKIKCYGKLHLHSIASRIYATCASQSGPAVSLGRSISPRSSDHGLWPAAIRSQRLAL